MIEGLIYRMVWSKVQFSNYPSTSRYVISTFSTVKIMRYIIWLFMDFEESIGVYLKCEFVNNIPNDLNQ